MKLALLVTYWPWPLDTGTRIRIYQILRFLSAHCEIHLLVVSTAEVPFSARQKEVGLASAEIFDPRQYRPRGFPYLRARLAQCLHLRPCMYSPLLRQRIAAALERLRPQMLIAFGTASAQFIDLEKRQPGTLYVFDETGTDHLRVSRLLAAEQSLSRRLRLCWDFWRLRRYEHRVCSKADRLLAVSLGEAEYVRKWVRGVPVTVAPCGANLELFEFHYAGDDNHTIMFCGDLTYAPNEDAMVYFLESIFPAIAARHPEVALAIVGRYREGRLPSLSARFSQVSLTGYVEDMNPHWRRASIFVNPMRQGRGAITKLMDAFTAGLAVVSTDFLMEELGIVPDRHFLCAADARGFAEAVCHLLENPQKKRELVKAARSFAEAHGWKETLKPLREILPRNGADSA